MGMAATNLPTTAVASGGSRLVRVIITKGDLLALHGRPSGVFLPFTGSDILRDIESSL